MRIWALLGSWRGSQPLANAPDWETVRVLSDSAGLVQERVRSNRKGAARRNIWALENTGAAQTTQRAASHSCQQQHPPALIVTSLISMQAYLRRDAGVAEHGRLASGLAYVAPQEYCVQQLVLLLMLCKPL